MRSRLWWAWLLGVTLSGCVYAPIPDAPPPVEQPPDLPPPPPPPPPPPDTPVPPITNVPAVGTPKADVIAAWGAGSDLPENPGEPDSVAYVRQVDGRDAEIHVIYVDGKVARVVVTFLVTPGGG